MELIYKSFNKYFLHKKNIIVYCKIISYNILLYIVDKTLCIKTVIEKIIIFYKQKQICKEKQLCLYIN